MNPEGQYHTVPNIKLKASNQSNVSMTGLGSRSHRVKYKYLYLSTNLSVLDVLKIKVLVLGLGRYIPSSTFQILRYHMTDGQKEQVLHFIQTLKVVNIRSRLE